MLSGTQEKCKGCTKTVYFIEMVSADGANYHKACFKCAHCHARLLMSNYYSMDGVLYCKPHFDKLFKDPRSFNKTPLPSGKEQTNEPVVSLPKAPTKLSRMFSGTLDKCAVCKKTVYPLEKVTVEGDGYHRACFRCSHGGCTLTPSSYASLDGFLYCKPHFAQLFKRNGSYAHLTKTASLRKTPPPPPTHPRPSPPEPLPTAVPSGPPPQS